MYFKNRIITEEHNLAQGGTAVGTGLNTEKILIKKLLKKLVKLQEFPLRLRQISSLH